MLEPRDVILGIMCARAIGSGFAGELRPPTAYCSDRSCHAGCSSCGASAKPTQSAPNILWPAGEPELGSFFGDQTVGIVNPFSTTSGR
jgi:hypothetical protein